MPLELRIVAIYYTGICLVDLHRQCVLCAKHQLNETNAIQRIVCFAIGSSYTKLQNFHCLIKFIYLFLSLFFPLTSAVIIVRME